MFSSGGGAYAGQPAYPGIQQQMTGYGGYQPSPYGQQPVQGYGGYAVAPTYPPPAAPTAPTYPPPAAPVAPGYPQPAPAYPQPGVSAYPQPSPSVYQQPGITAYPQPAPSVYPQAYAPVAPVIPGQTFQPIGQPGLMPPVGLNNTPEQDCQILHNAMKGAGTDEEAIINLIVNRTAEQRQHIRKTYFACFGTDLIKKLKSELSGNFEEAVIGCFMGHAEYDAYLLYKAMKGLGTNEGVLIEVIGTRNNYELTQIKQEFQKNYGKPLEKWITSETSGNLRKLLIALLQCQRSENTVPNPTMCQTDAQALFQAGEGRWGTDESTFRRIFAQRSGAELNMISQYYSQLRGRTLLQAIEKEFSGDIKNLLSTIVKFVTDPSGYFANRIRESVEGIGTNDSKLIRVIISRCEIDMPQIKQAYTRLFGRDMLHDVRSDTSGDYRRILSYLISRV